MFDTSGIQSVTRGPEEPVGEVTISQPDWMGGGVLATVAGGHVSAVPWLKSKRVWLAAQLRTRGALLLRGFGPLSMEKFEEAATVIGGGGPQPYANRSTPRTTVHGNIYTSTEYPPSESIPLHSENSYSNTWPRAILFLCIQPAAAGGETPIADNRRVYAEIPPGVRDLFESKALTYIRNYGDLGLSWQETFQSPHPHEVERYCRQNDMQWSWRAGGKLRTLQTLAAVRKHPVTGERVWFNQAHLFHPSSLGRVGDELLDLFGAEGMPRTARYGDGSQIEPSHLDEVRAAYDKHAVPIPWQQNDLVILDNMLWSHGRRPFSGPRRVVVAMTGTLQSSSAA